MQGGAKGEAGSASIEHAALVALVALILILAIAALAADRRMDAGRSLAGTLARKLACAPRVPDSCRRHPLVPAYGWPLARLTRSLAPAPVAKTAPGGLPLVPVDFRHCRRPSCAVPRPGADGVHLTVSGRRTTAFTEVVDRRRSEGWVQVTFWLYRPSLGWEAVIRRAMQADVEAASRVPVLHSQDPSLVPLEILPGRDHYDFPAGERPPWQWRLEGRYPGWSS